MKKNDSRKKCYLKRNKIHGWKKVGKKGKPFRLFKMMPGTMNDGSAQECDR